VFVRSRSGLAHQHVGSLHASDAEMAITDDAGQAGGIARRRLVEAIDVDVIVAEAVHLSETHWFSSLAPTV